MKDELTHQESLDLIAEMIKQAKRNVAKGGSNQILLWGWTIAFANFGHYALHYLPGSNCLFYNGDKNGPVGSNRAYRQGVW